jgi:hypothetical protein
MPSRILLPCLIAAWLAGCDGPATVGGPASSAIPIRAGSYRPPDPPPKFPPVPAECAREKLVKGDAFGRSATRLNWVYQCEREIVIASPDGRSRARIYPGEDEMRLQVSGAAGEFEASFYNGPNSALSWAPDSRALFLTVNEGGIVGNYKLSIVAELDAFPGLDMWDFTHLVHEAFGHPVRCFSPEHPNVAGIAWLGSSKRLLVAAEILPHSNCDRMGNFTGYVLDPFEGTIVHRYDQPEMKRRFGHLLGPELLNADDNCAARPESCWIPQLHPEARRR